jgi:hypothetical protein
VDYVAYWAGSSLNVQIVDQPASAGETFMVDAVTILANPGTLASAGLAVAGEAPPVAEAPADSSISAAIARPGGLAPRVAPNPLRTSARIAFRLEQPTPVRILVFDVGGRLVRTLPGGSQTSAGWNSVDLDGRSDNGAPLRSGIYLYEIRAGGQRAVGRFVIMR